ncbi:Parafibromin [Geodia barretti]|uniref:Parafibromin n=1 Tax=Geodia barretti TaxID=519541 RepID=A0AA35S3Q9_GEOBA|nr:Parafibromin [Geodia barretti]
MADCLTLLRQYNLQKKEIVERDGLIIFDQTAWPGNAKTNYLSYRSGQAGLKEYYTLESLLFLLKNVSLSHPSYVARAGAQNIPVIKFPDRRDLLKYLNGELDTSPSIDKSVHLEMGMPAPAPKRTNEEAQPEAAKKPRIESEADKQRLAKKLEAKGKGGAITDQVHSLSDAISREKIAAFKAKRLAKKRATIKPGDDLAGGPDRMFINDATKEIMSKERVHRTRSSALQSTGKDFSNIFSLLQSVKARDEGRGGEVGGGGGGKQPVPEEPRQPQTQAPPTHGYSRYGQEKFRGQEETGEFKIDTPARTTD